MESNWSTALRLEHKFTEIIAKQEQIGVNFDKEGAERHVAFLQQEMDRLYGEIRPLLEPELEARWQTMWEPFRKDGTFKKPVEDVFYGLGEDSIDDGHSSLGYSGLGNRPDIAGPFDWVRWVEPDIGSRQKLMKQLAKHGWEPTEYTEKGNPRLTEDSLEGLGGAGEKIATWYKLSHRQSQIQGWLDNVRTDGRIESRVVPNSTNTGRVAHKVVANIPKANSDEDGNLLYYPNGKVVYGTEMRQLFLASPGRKLVGADAAQLELRILAHYMDDRELIKQVAEGDPHTYFWKACDDLVDSRSTMKNIEYALIYGAGDFKLGITAGYPNREAKQKGKAIRDRILYAFPKLKQLTEGVQKASQRGYLVAPDGRKVWMRKDTGGKILSHKALNTLIQTAGSVTIKTATCFADKWLNDEGLDAPQVIYMHDESQRDCKESHVKRVSELVERSFSKAGEFYGFRCPLEGEAIVGPTWAHTH